MDLLPTHPTPEMTHAVETILDYGCDWTYIVENNLDTPHLYWLHDGSIPPIESLGCSRENVGKISNPNPNPDPNPNPNPNPHPHSNPNPYP